MEISAQDRRILDIICREGRLPVVDLAERVGLAATTVGERLKKLQKSGVIRGFRAEIDPRRIGLDLLVFVEVLLDKTTPDVMTEFSTAIRRVPDVLECHMVAGGFDFLIKVRARDMTDYRRFLGNTLWVLPGVKETRTYTVMEEIVSDNVLPL